MKKIFPLLVAASVLGMSCANSLQRERFSPHDAIRSVKKEEAFLKTHMKSGSLYVFSSWASDTAAKTISGEATLYDINRNSIHSGMITIGTDSIAIAETNHLDVSPSTTMISIMTVASLGVTIYCQANPKACFGSCPTFYVQSGDSLQLRAEGFSSSVAPSLEVADADALLEGSPQSRDYVLTMKNEALETHVVRHADILAVSKNGSARIFKNTRGEFLRCGIPQSPLQASNAGGSDCTALLKAMDGHERFSTTDSADLAEREEIEVEFLKAPATQAGIVIGARQTLLSTYLFYQTLAYLGTGAGEWFARLENDKTGFLKSQIRRAELHLGGIDVLAQNSAGEWESIGEIYEHGPLASDTHILPLPKWAQNSQKFRIRVAKGNWRIDYVARAEIHGEAEVDRVQPLSVFKNNQPVPAALAQLTDPLQTLVTLPGDNFDIHYKLPENFADCEIFLESKGYYIEWMRQEWLTEENPALALEIFTAPKKALKRLAPKFKALEHTMEESFWRSRYAGR